MTVNATGRTQNVIGIRVGGLPTASPVSVTVSTAIAIAIAVAVAVPTAIAVAIPTTTTIAIAVSTAVAAAVPVPVPDRIVVRHCLFRDAVHGLGDLFAAWWQWLGSGGICWRVGDNDDGGGLSDSSGFDWGGGTGAVHGLAGVRTRCHGLVLCGGGRDEGGHRE
jgi:hypothetical protein